MKKLILAICILCLFFGALGMAAMSAPVLQASSSMEVAGVVPPPPPTSILINPTSLPHPNVAWNS